MRCSAESRSRCVRRLVSLPCCSRLLHGYGLVRRGRRAGCTRRSAIISLIPAVTEMLFAIGAGPAGRRRSAASTVIRPRSRSCRGSARCIDPDLERILSLRPDLVVVYGSQTDLRAARARAGIRSSSTPRRAGRRDDDDPATRRRGSAAREAADALAERDRARAWPRSRQRVAGRPRPRTLLVFGRETVALRGIYASGGVGFLHDMLEAAGGANVFADVKRETVQATTELILARRPDVILELRARRTAGRGPRSTARDGRLAARCGSVPAVAHRHASTSSPIERTVVPGPRVAEAAELPSPGRFIRTAFERLASRSSQLVQPARLDQALTLRELDRHPLRDQALLEGFGHAAARGRWRPRSP